MSAVGGVHEKLFVCYVPSLDLRRIGEERTPYIASLMQEFQPVRLRGLPDTELLATILTGAWPHEHGLWQLRLRPEGPPASGLRARIEASLPAGLTTTLQGLAHLATGRVDLATMAPARRQTFELHRFKYERRAGGSWVEPAPEMPSIFSVLGDGASRYHFTRRLGELDRLQQEFPSGGQQLEFLELYALDLLQHWNLDRPERVDEGFRRVDDFVRTVHARARNEGVGLVLLSDHGQERITGAIDLRRVLQESGAPTEDYAYYIQVPSARFWFHTARARERIRAALAELEDVTVLDYRAMAEHGARFDTADYGELYAYADPGRVFFPHDFYHPVANLFLGLSDPAQRPRIFDPVHRGCHGYLTGHDSETGLFLVPDSRWVPRVEAGELVDVAPTLLRMLGEPVPERMSGRSLLEPRG